METFVKKIKEELDRELAQVEPEKSPVKGHDQRVRLIIYAICDLKDYLLKHPFKRVADEVHYFKHRVPYFYQLYFYHAKLCRFELARITSSREEILLYIEAEEKRAKEFYIKHEDFCRYTYIGGTSQDEQLFTHGIRENAILDEVALIMDDNFCLGSYWLSWLRTYEVYSPFLQQERLIAENKPVSEHVVVPRRKYTWTANDTDLVELIYGLYGTNAIEVDGRKMSIKDLAEMCKEFFQIDLGNVYDTQGHNLSRKKDKVPFLNSMIQSIMPKA